MTLVLHGTRFGMMFNTQVGDSIWNGDEIQIAIDPTGKRVQFDGNSFEYNFGLGAGDKVRDDSKKKTYYELRIPAGDIAPAEFKPDSKIGFAMIVNDGDKQGGREFRCA